MKWPHLEIKAEKGKPRNKIKGQGLPRDYLIYSFFIDYLIFKFKYSFLSLSIFLFQC